MPTISDDWKSSRGFDAAATPEISAALPAETSALLEDRRLDAGSSRTPQWLAAVSGSAAIALILATVAPGVVVVLAGLLIALIAIGDVVSEVVTTRLSALRDDHEHHLKRLELLLALDVMADPTHGYLQPAAESLAVARSRLSARGSARELDVLDRAHTLISGLERSIRESHGSRMGSRLVGARAIGALAHKAVEQQADQPTMKLYSDQTNLPDSLHPTVRAGLLSVGAVLDDVRQLHSSQIEWSVLLFTLWSRFLLLVCAPFMAALTLSHVPLSGDGFAARDVAWLLALAAATGTVAVAPWIATTVMRRDDTGARVRQLLLVLEVPVAVAAIIAFPAWPVVAFAAGWTNWWQRPEFSWLKLAAWIAMVVGAQVVGMLLAGEDGSVLVIEPVIALAVIGLIGGSYGAMLPVSLSMLARVLAGGLFSRQRARRRADTELGASIRQLFAAARAIEDAIEPEDWVARREANALREIASTLAAGADARDRWARRTPAGLAAAVANALAKGGPASGSPLAELATVEAEQLDLPEPVTIAPPTFHTSELERLRFRERRAARSLSLLIVEITREARRYGTGVLTTSCVEENGRVVLRLANPMREAHERPPGRGTGGDRLNGLVEAIPGGTLDLREPVDGRFVSMPPQVRRFGVQISFPSALLEGDR